MAVNTNNNTNNNKYNFHDKVALVTGSSSGIGAAVALQFARYGASVVITGRDAKALAEVGQHIHKETGSAPVEVVADLLNDDTPGQLIAQTIDKFGRLDILVNNAGGSTPSGKLVNNPKLLEEFDNVLRLNVRSVVALTQLAVPHLEKTKGNVVNISSVVGIRPLQVVYSTSKAALDMVTKCAAQELGPLGVRVNSVNPGAVVTGFGRSINMPNIYTEYEEMCRKASPLDRVGQPAEIANLVSFLASDDAVNITGSILVNDGGYLVKGSA